MPTTTNVTNLMINELTEAQYDTAVQGGTIGANEISILTDVEDKPVQVSTLPTAGADELGNIYQFVGITDANYTNGYFYKCVSDGGNPATYSWTAVQVQAGGGSSLPSQTGNSGKFLTTDGTDASWSDKPLVNNTTTENSLAIGTTLNTTQQYAILIGKALTATPYGSAGDGAILIGNNIRSGNYFNGVCITPNASGVTQTETGAVAIGRRASNTNGNGCAIAIGNTARTTAANAIQLGGVIGQNPTNSDADTFKVCNGNGNFEIMSADGTIPAARHASLPAADGTYVLKLVISGGVPTLSWVAE